MDQEQLMARAREAWQASTPSEGEIHRGAERVGRRLRSRGKPFAPRKIVVSVGACAAFLAALAYAGSQNWIEVPRSRHHEPETTAAAPAAQSAELTAPPESHLPSPPPVGNDAVLGVPPAPLEPLRRQGTIASPPPPPSSIPSWGDVSEALSGSDEHRAEGLLTDLARRGHDANDRAKAKLGLAQLEASHGNCPAARVLSLQVAAVQGIELKTVRRALELAAHCTK